MIFKQREVSIKAIYAEVKKFVSLPFWKFKETKRLSRIGFIQSPKDKILILLKKKLIASKLDAPKPKKFKEMMDWTRTDLLDNCPTLKRRMKKLVFRL